MPAIQNVYECVMQGQATTSSGGIRNIWNVFHYRQTSGTVLSFATVGDAFRDQVAANIVPLLSSTYTGAAILTRRMDVYTDAYEGSGFVQVGGKTGARLPNMVAVTVQLHCRDRGKEFKGSKHFGPIIESDQTGDELSPTVVPSWDAVLAACVHVLAVGGVNLVPVVLSRKLSSNTPQLVALVGSDITFGRLNKTLGTMRRRKEKVVTA